MALIFETNLSLPLEVRKSIPDEGAQSVLRTLVNSHLTIGVSEPLAFAKAYRVLEQMGFEYMEGSWVEKAGPTVGDVHVDHPIGAIRPLSQNGKKKPIEKIIREEKGKWHVYSHDGAKHLGGPYDTKAEAVTRLGQVEHFKDKAEEEKDDPGTEEADTSDLLTDEPPEKVKKKISGNSDVSLSTEGKEMAKLLGERLAAKGGLDILYSSPLNRAVETAEAIVEAAPKDSIHYGKQDDLRPWRLGSFEGKSSADSADAIDELIKDPRKVPPGKGSDGEKAEPFSQASQRQLSFLSNVYNDSEDDESGTKVGIIMHARGLELLQAWVDEGQPDNFELDTDSLINPDDPEHASVMYWDKDKIEEIDLDEDDKLKPGVYLILHSLTADDTDTGNKDLKKVLEPSVSKSTELVEPEGPKVDTPIISVKKYIPPQEVYQAAAMAWASGFTVLGITSALAEQEGIGEDEIRKIVEHFSDVKSVTESKTTQAAWGGRHAQKWAERVLRKIQRDGIVFEDLTKEDDDYPYDQVFKAEGDDVDWITVHGQHIPIGGGREPTKSELAKKSYNPATKEKQQRGDLSEIRLAKELGLERTGNNKAFDLRKGKIGIEIKTLVDSKIDKITMRKECRLRKLEEAKREKLRIYTVVCDARSGQSKYYFRAGVGNFYLNTMKRVTLDELKTHIK